MKPHLGLGAGASLHAKVELESSWDEPYRSAGDGRLWPADPTIRAGDLAAFRECGARVVLDAGCGDGKNLRHLVEQGFAGLGADASPAALETCRRFLDGGGLTGRYALLTPVPLERLPLLADGLHGVLCIDVLGHVRKPQPILRRLASIVAPGGVLLVSLFHPDDECRTGPRMAEAEAPGEYWYTPPDPALHAGGRRFFYRFSDEADVRRRLRIPRLELLSLEARQWREPPHPGYRDEEHRHVSWFALLERQGA